MADDADDAWEVVESDGSAERHERADGTWLEHWPGTIRAGGPDPTAAAALVRDGAVDRHPPGIEPLLDAVDRVEGVRSWTARRDPRWAGTVRVGTDDPGVDVTARVGPDGVERLTYEFGPEPGALADALGLDGEPLDVARPRAERTTEPALPDPPDGLDGDADRWVATRVYRRGYGFGREATDLLVVGPPPSEGWLSPAADLAWCPWHADEDPPAALADATVVTPDVDEPVAESFAATVREALDGSLVDHVATAVDRDEGDDDPEGREEETESEADGNGAPGEGSATDRAHDESRAPDAAGRDPDPERGR